MHTDTWWLFNKWHVISSTETLRQFKGGTSKPCGTGWWIQCQSWPRRRPGRAPGQIRHLQPALLCEDTSTYVLGLFFLFLHQENYIEAIVLYQILHLFMKTHTYLSRAILPHPSRCKKQNAPSPSLCFWTEHVTARYTQVLPSWTRVMHTCQLALASFYQIFILNVNKGYSIQPTPQPRSAVNQFWISLVLPRLVCCASGMSLSLTVPYGPLPASITHLEFIVLCCCVFVCVWLISTRFFSPCGHRLRNHHPPPSAHTHTMGSTSPKHCFLVVPDSQNASCSCLNSASSNISLQISVIVNDDDAGT